MTDKEKFRDEVKKLKSQLLRGACSSQIAMETICKEEAYNEVLAIIDNTQEEPVSIWHDASEIPQEGSLILREIGISQKGYGVIRYSKELPSFPKHCEDIPIQKWAYIDDILKLSNVERIGKDWKEPVSEELKEAIDTYLATYFGGEKEKQEWPFLKKMAIYFAEWQKQKDSIPASEELENVSKEWLRPQLDKSYANYGEAKMMELTHFDGYAMFDAIEFGAKWQKEQMMKDAISLKVKETFGKGDEVAWVIRPSKILDKKFNAGEKVKLIVIKED